MPTDNTGVQTRAMAQHTDSEPQETQNQNVNPTVELYKSKDESIKDFVRKHGTIALDWYVPNFSNTRVREMFPDTKGILETGTDTQIPRPPSKLHIVHRCIKVCLRWRTNTTQRWSRPPHHIRKWTISWITIKLSNTHKGGLCNLHVNQEAQLLYQHSQNNSQK